MNAIPLDGRVVLEAFSDRSQQIRPLPYLLMTIHTCLGGRGICKARRFDRGMAVTAVDSQLTDMVSVTECDGLWRSLVNSRGVARTVECGSSNPTGRSKKREADYDDSANRVES